MKNSIISFVFGMLLATAITFALIPKKDKSYYISTVTVGNDTIVYTGQFSTDISKVSGFLAHGGWDSMRTVYREEIHLNNPVIDTQDVFISSGSSQQNVNTGTGSQVITNK